MDNFVITIGREFGSGGLDVARKLSDKLNVKYYDKELLAMAAKESGLCEEIFENHDEKPNQQFFILIGYGYIFCQRIHIGAFFRHAAKSQSISGTV